MLLIFATKREPVFYFSSEMAHANHALIYVLWLTFSVPSFVNMKLQVRIPSYGVTWENHYMKPLALLHARGPENIPWELSFEGKKTF